MTVPTTASEAGSRLASARASGKRLTIAVLFDNANFFEGCYEAKLREALDAKCRQDGHNLLLLYGGPLDAPWPMNAADNLIFKALRPDSCDAIIVVSSMLAAFCGPNPVARLVETYRPAPLCSVGLALPGIPSLVLDNRAGMETAIEHLIHDHGVRRPVFLAGIPKNPEAQERLDAYQAVLARNGIPFDGAMVICGHFMPKQGRAAMDELLAAGIPFDAVVAANDNMALGAIEALRKWGRRVPRDIPVTGFDDLPLAGVGNPPLTTVSQPLERMAALAIETVLAQLAGEQVPECRVLPSELVRRRSCGCEFDQHIRAQPIVFKDEPTTSQARIERLRSGLSNTLRRHSAAAEQVSDRLIDGLQSEDRGQRRAFQRAVGDMLDDLGDESEHHRLIQDAIVWLRDELADVSNLDLERAFFEGLNLVAASSTTTQARQRVTLEDNYATLLSVSEQAAVAFDLSSLRETLVKGFPAAGVRTAFLSCAVEDKPDELSPVVSLVNGQAIDDAETRFPRHRLLPSSALVLAPRRTFLVFPMAFETQLLGVAAFDYADGVRSYAVFRNEITAVLKTIRLHQELVQKTMLHERSVQERLATTKRMEALSVLAGGVAHDLNNALGPLVALPDIILRELHRVKANEHTVRDLFSDVEIIKAASLRAAQTIKDLLTLGRQGRTQKENLDLNRVVKVCRAETLLRLASDASRQINLDVHYAPGRLLVRASESQLARAVGNLVHNAVEAIEDNGQVVVNTRHELLTTPTGSYETIPAGRYAVLTVSDNGCGIEAQDLGRVFEPFFTKKRTGESTGSGLGLAIVHGVVKEHDGFIDVTSTTSVGTTFTLYFPTTTAPEPRHESPSALPHGHARILVVDDEQVQLRTCRRVLTRLGYTVETSASGQLACEMFRQAAATRTSPFDLVVVDMLLGEAADGLEVIAQIRSVFPGQMAIIVSGHAPTDRTEEASKHGVPWLAKPYGLEELAKAVADALGNKASAPR